MTQSLSTPKGTRDFSPAEMIKRNYIFDTIKQIFIKYGYLPLETPSMENLSTLMGKYGAEGDKLLFKILNSGDFQKKISQGDVDTLSTGALATKISEKGLRYDLTVPFARYVVQNRSNIVFPFKRYQIQPVWRADRPQKGRYREFYQCDVDIVGSTSLINELELIQIVNEVFKKLSIAITMKLNNRKILYGIAESVGYADKMMDITIAIDKLDKIGIDAVNQELLNNGISQKAVDMLRPILTLTGANDEKLDRISQIISQSEVGMKGIEEVREIINYVDNLKVDIDLELDLSLARGLNYYTGAIFEVKAKDYEIGSISGGGRYDDLTGIFGLKNVSGVGISFGADRIYDVLNGLDLFPEDSQQTTKVMFVNFGGESLIQSLKLLLDVRKEGVASEIYPESVKIKKQMDYANKRNIPYVAIIGEEEIESQVASLKDMNTGEQWKVKFDILHSLF